MSKRSPLASEVFMDGFLDPRAAQWSQRFRREHRDWANLFRDANRLAVRCLIEMTVDKADRVGVAICVHYVRLLHDAQCAVKLLELGAVGPCRVLLRTMLEAAFRVAALRKDSDSVDRLAPHHTAQTIEYLDGLAKSDYAGLLDDERQAMVSEAARLAEVPPEERRKTKVWKWAEIGGLSDLYNTAYRHLSDAVHVGMNGLNEYVTADDQCEIEEIAWGASIRDPRTDYITAVEVICLTVRIVESYVKFPVEKSVDEILVRMRALAPGEQAHEEATQ